MCEQIAKFMGNWDSIDQNVWRMQPCEEYSPTYPPHPPSLCGERGSPFASSYKHGRDLKSKNFPESPPIIHDQCDNSILVIVVQMVTSNNKLCAFPPTWGLRVGSLSTSSWRGSSLYPQAAIRGGKAGATKGLFLDLSLQKTLKFRSH